jgi:hypothetical protein
MSDALKACTKHASFNSEYAAFDSLRGDLIPAQGYEGTCAFPKRNASQVYEALAVSEVLTLAEQHPTAAIHFPVQSRPSPFAPRIANHSLPRLPSGLI